MTLGAVLAMFKGEMKRTRMSLITTGIALSLAAATVPVASAAGPAGATKGDRQSLLVKFVSSADGRVRVAAAGDEHIGKTRTRVDVVKIDGDESLAAKLA